MPVIVRDGPKKTYDEILKIEVLALLKNKTKQ